MSCCVGILNVLRNMLFLNIYPCNEQHINAWTKTKKNTYMVLKFNANTQSKLNNSGWLKYVGIRII
jgi:hypothetical protein